MIEVSHLSKSFGETEVLRAVDLTVARAEIVALLGPSGCGKTTLLRLLAGLERPDSGEIKVDGELLSSPTKLVPPEARHIGLVFQDFALFPHLRVTANIAFGLAHLDRAQRDQKVRETLARFGLTALADRYPHELSGGQQQRVALARAVAPEPRVLLMDEPFSNLDTALRRRLRVELKQTLRDIGIATVFVTHDQSEALSLADRVAVMDLGQIAQCAPPETVYRRPASLAVAHATGQVLPLPGQARSGQVETALGALSGHGPDGDVTVLLRPESLLPSPDGVKARVTSRDYTGADLELWLDVAGHTLAMHLPADPSKVLPAEGDTLRVSVGGPVSWIPRTKAPERP
jgi:iron(III) transport system ATP-binding protein